METIAEAYARNDRIHAELKAAVAGLTEEQLRWRPDGEDWSIQEIVEHIAIVYQGSAGICTRLVHAAKEAGKTGDGKINLSGTFAEKADSIAERRLEAPERVRPKGEVPVEASLEKIAETQAAFERLRPDMEAFDLSGHTFPHPYFGEITAAEWLVLAGGHAARHRAQIEGLKTQL